MPHIIVEYSKSLEPQTDVLALVNDLHEGLAAQGIDKARIKSRAIAVDHVVVGDKGADGVMAHATLLLLEGRDIATKKQYGDVLYEVMKAAAPQGCSVTLEVRDMVKDTYYM
ncbi:MAG: 5-carboxymethyl-2-hydroxymuconate Delta-isomerase [Alphaproteobacteria bacterium]